MTTTPPQTKAGSPDETPGVEDNLPRKQRVPRVRRIYNQWVANQTLEDYSLRFTAKSARRFSCFQVANTALGAVSFLALEAIGGVITIMYGFQNAVMAILAVSALIFLTGLPIAYHAARSGLDIDLLTRGAGFGYIGSTITSLIYASFTFIFFAIEAAILALLLEMWFGLPLWAGYTLGAVAVIPLVTHGITLISRFQSWTQPFWLSLHLLPFIALGVQGLIDLEGWIAFPGTYAKADGGFDLLLFGAASAVIFALLAQIGEQVDYLRFLPHAPSTLKGRLSWWAALLAAGPGWIIPGALKMLLGSFLAYFVISIGGTPDQAIEPNEMYLAAFQQVTTNAELAMLLTGLFVILSQMKINVTNAYAGSIAWSNFFSRLTRSHPGRVVWLVFNVAIALLLMQIGIYKALEQILSLYCLVAVAWVGALVADLLVNKPLGLSPSHIEFKRAHLYDVNPVGLGSMFISLLSGVTAYIGLFGDTAQALAPYLALIVPFITAPLIALLTGSSYYIARTPKSDWEASQVICCSVCEHAFESEDMAQCPAYGGPICSLCCSLDARCHDLCKPDARFSLQILAVLNALLPATLVQRFHSRFGKYVFLLLVMVVVVGSSLAVIYVQATLNDRLHAEVVAATLWQTFFILFLIAGVVAWLIVLAHESRVSAENESRYQNDLLIAEIDAHERTDYELQKAKEVAEAANMAKSRYMVGMSHELRTPLNTVLGYAQLLERDPEFSEHHRNSVQVLKRSAEHLSGLIDGVLDISRIEAGRLELHREEVNIRELLDQLVQVFRRQAEGKGITLIFECAERLPKAVYTDERRLRQVLINLLSNAVKFTDEGQIHFSVDYGGQVATFQVSDTGLGIPESQLESIFKPFERMASNQGAPRPGMGIGLTITKLLAEIMGGDIKADSQIGVGSRFRVRLMLSEVPRLQQPDAPPQRIVGYQGECCRIMVVDDEAPHRDMLAEFLDDLGFEVDTAFDGEMCLQQARQSPPDLFLLDITMPGMNGWELAERLQAIGQQGAILMVSADASGLQRFSRGEGPWSDYATKPVDLTQLLEKVGRALGLHWVHEESLHSTPLTPPLVLPPETLLSALERMARIGHVVGVQAQLSRIQQQAPESVAFVEHACLLAQRYQFASLLELICRLRAGTQEENDG
ncbi:response regulator [Vreelandella aquamarina]|uniref:hybrid sensor histidine kinase/response regulator n=1 Tax=Vreelandella aquamarina TaxID=77097 RepID=UPI00384D9E17